MALQAEIFTAPPLTATNFGTCWEPGYDNFAQGLPKTDRLRILGWLDACPRPTDLADIFGIDWIINRYAEANLIGGFIVDQARELNPKLAKQLSASIPRPEGEFPKIFDPQSVPETYVKTLSPGQTPVGYAAARVLIEEYGRDPQWKIGDPCVSQGNQILKEVLPLAKTPEEFLAILADRVVKADANPIAVLGHVFAAEFGEEGGLSLVREVAKEMVKHAPDLWEIYLKLSPEEQQKSGILTTSILLAK